MQEVFMIPSRKIFKKSLQEHSSRNILSSLLHHSYFTVVLCHANIVYQPSAQSEKMLACVSMFNSRLPLRSVQKLHRMKKWCI